MQQTCRLILSIIVLVSFIPPALVRAESGLPNSVAFGYGARLDLEGEHIDLALSLAGGLNLQWIGVDFDWARYWPEADTPPDFSALLHVIDHTVNSNLNLLVSIKNPPPWALTAVGPDPISTANLVVDLGRLGQGKILAFELFPGANTQAGWLSLPNPQNYLHLHRFVQNALMADSQPVYLVTSLSPLTGNYAQTDMDDLTFLEALYANGGQPYLTIVGLRLPQISGEPLTAENQAGVPVLRHYESIRAIMLRNGHTNGLIWITGFSLPIELQGISTNPELMSEQASWISSAYQLLKAQLFIGAAFFEQLNPRTASFSDHPRMTFMLPDSTLHPVCQQLSNLITEGSTSVITSRESDRIPSAPNPDSQNSSIQHHWKRLIDKNFGKVNKP